MRRGRGTIRPVSTEHSGNGKHALRTGPGAVPSIPLSPERGPGSDEASVGTLVRDATTHLSALVRSEVELAKAEIADEVKKATRGGIFFTIAGTIALFSLFIGFIALGEVFDIWLPRSAAFGIDFALMLLIAGVFGWLGFKRVKAIRKPERTITSVRETAQAMKPGDGS